MNLRKESKPASTNFIKKTWGAHVNATAPTAILAIALLAPEPAWAANQDPGADLRKARIAQKIRDADYWQTCRRIGSTLRAAHDPQKSEERAVLMTVSRESPYSVQAGHHAAIRNRKPEIGMSMCSVIAALGFPVRNNRSVNHYGERFQLVYEKPRMYVYLEGNHTADARVTGWQD